MSASPGIVMARFVEAAATEVFLPRPKVQNAPGYWPVFLYEKEDVDGWDDQAKLDNATRWRGRANAGAISRHHECMEWTSRLIGKSEWRKIVWAWAFCKAQKLDFSERCDKSGWVRCTAYRRLTSSFEAIAKHFDIKGVLVRLPDDKWLRHEAPNMAIETGRMAIDVESNSAIQYSMYSRPGKSISLIHTEEDQIELANYIQRHNASTDERRRKLMKYEQAQSAA